jgi:cobalt-zinc-cadmium efflux system outer membrane protein
MVSSFTLLGRYSVGLLMCIASVAALAAPADVNFKTYLAAVLQAHPELKAADANIAAAEARAEAMTRPIYNPELGVETQRAQAESVSVGLSQTLDFTGKRSAREASGQKLLAVAVAERAGMQQGIATETFKALIELDGAQTAADLTQKRLELLERFADIADQQYKIGDIGVLDRDLPALARAEAIAMSGRAELSLLKAQQGLEVATRAPALSLPSLPASPPNVANLTSDYEALGKALPAVRAANAKTEAAKSEIDIARSQGRADPTVGFRVGGEHDRGGGNSENLVGLHLSIPLFLRNNFRAETNAARAQADASRIESDASYQAALVRMKAAATQYRRSYAAWQRWNASASNRIESGVELLERVWRVREISTAEYLVQLKQLLDGRTAGEELRTQTWLSWAEWLAASGDWQHWLDTVASTHTIESSSVTMENAQ